MGSREIEVAERTLDASILAQARAAADAYPDLKIVCPFGCCESVLGAAYGEHADGHERGRAGMPDRWWVT
jgi:hypothetical protein